MVSEPLLSVKGREAFDTKSDVWHTKRRKSDSPSHVKHTLIILPQTSIIRIKAKV